MQEPPSRDWRPLDELVQRLEVLNWWAENQPNGVQVAVPTVGFSASWEWPTRVPVLLVAPLAQWPIREPEHVREARAWVRRHYPHAEPPGSRP